MLKISNLSKSYGEINLYKHFTYEFRENAITVLLGPSGCGKTSLLNMLAGLADIDGGAIQGLEGKALTYIFQESRLLPWLSVYDNLYIVAEKHQKNPRQLTEELLIEVDLWEARYLFPEQISGGMQQRLAVVRAFAKPSDIILMDEPFKSLDFEMKIQLIKYFYKIWEKQKQLVIFVTHDFMEAALLGDEICLLADNPVNILKKISNPIEYSNRQYENIKLLEFGQGLYKEVIKLQDVK